MGLHGFLEGQFYFFYTFSLSLAAFKMVNKRDLHTGNLALAPELLD
jgi:hypothetical protein